MLNVVETFSGIGSQAKALRNIGVEYKIVATVEWDINAIYAYDIIHNGTQNLTGYVQYNKEQLIDKLMVHTISYGGKKPLERNTLKMMSVDALRRFMCAIERTKNLISITDVKATDLPKKVDLLTYSFPCQDLSVCGSWHGNMSGIDRDANNRSGMLWQIERILKEYVELGKKLPKFLLMENVSNILSETHRHNFEEWKCYLEGIGYTNQVYTLNAANFGIPQKRVRTFMLSVYTRDMRKKDKIKKYFQENNLENREATPLNELTKYLKIDYTDPRYKLESDESNPNFTPSRKRIFQENDIIFDGKTTNCDAIKTITTKQDRNPNSGLVIYSGNTDEKAPYRNLTPRECFLLMGFDEDDFQALMDNDFNINKSRRFFTREKLIKLAGNSIVVDVLETIFKQVIYIKDYILVANSEFGVVDSVLCSYPDLKKESNIIYTCSESKKVAGIGCS